MNGSCQAAVEQPRYRRLDSSRSSGPALRLILIMHGGQAKLRETEEAEGPVAVDVEHPQVITVAGVVHHHLEMAAIAGRYRVEGKLVRDKLADPVRLQG